MQDHVWLARQFERERPRLRVVAYRMLGSSADAEDAVQNAWLRLDRADTTDIENLGGWLTTVVARECLHLLRSRRIRREDLLDPLAERQPDPVVATLGDERAEQQDPERQAVRADSVSLALLVVLDSLSPAERVSFVLHDMFGVPFGEIAPLVERTPAATRQLASRARRSVRGRTPADDGDRARQQRVVTAFYRAANEGDFAALLQVLDPHVVLRADYGPGHPTQVFRGAEKIARQSQAARGAETHLVLVNGLPGAVNFRHGQAVSLMAFAVVADRIVAIDGIRDPDRVRRLTAAVIKVRP